MAGVLNLEKYGTSQGKVAGLARTLFYLLWKAPTIVSLFETQHLIKISKIVFITLVQPSASEIQSSEIKFM